MPASPLAGQAQTVLGPIAGEAMGITLPHEHLLIDFEVMFKEPANGSERGLARQPVSLANLGWVRQHFSSNLDNLQLLDERVARDEALLFKHAGGQTFVDPTNRGLARDPLALARVARATGLNIIMGSGYYVDAAHPPDMGARTADQVAREIVADLTGASMRRACARASSVRSAPRGPGRTTRRRSCERRWPLSARRGPPS